MFKYIEQYKGLPKEIYIITFAKMVNAMGNFVIPFLTFYLERKLKLPENQAGEILLMATFMFVPGSIIGGKLTDSFGRKKIITVFHGLAAILLLVCGYLGVNIIVPKLLIISRLCMSISSPAYVAMNMDLTKPDNRKECMSFMYLGVNLGCAIGPLIAGFLFEKYLMWIFIGDAVTTFAALIILNVYVKETKPTKEDIKEIEHSDRVLEKAEQGTAMHAFLRRPNLVMFCFLGMIISFIYVQHSFTIPLQLSNIFNEKGTEIFGYMMSINGLVVILSTPILIYITKKLQPIKCVAIAALFYSVGFGMLYFANGIWIFIISAIIWTFGEVLESTQISVYIANHTPISHRGRFNSLSEIVRGTGYALGPKIIGKYLHAGNTIENVWKICFIAGMVASVLFYSLNLLENKKGETIK